MAEHSEDFPLVERLRAAADKSANGGGEWFQLVHRCREAADEIERLLSQVRGLTEQRDDLLLLLDSIGLTITDALGGRDMDALRRARLTGSPVEETP